MKTDEEKLAFPWLVNAGTLAATLAGTKIDITVDGTTGTGIKIYTLAQRP